MSKTHDKDECSLRMHCAFVEEKIINYIMCSYLNAQLVFFFNDLTFSFSGFFLRWIMMANNSKTF